MGYRGSRFRWSGIEVRGGLGQGGGIRVLEVCGSRWVGERRIKDAECKEEEIVRDGKMSELVK